MNIKEWFKTPAQWREEQYEMISSLTNEYQDKIQDLIKTHMSEIENLKEQYDKDLKAEINKVLKNTLEENYKSKKDSDEPWVSVINVSIDPEDPQNGEFELDWNEAFIVHLRQYGFTGLDDSEVLDAWFQSVCQNIAFSVYEDMDYDGLVPKENLIKKEQIDPQRTGYS